MNQGFVCFQRAASLQNCYCCLWAYDDQFEWQILNLLARLIWVSSMVKVRPNTTFPLALRMIGLQCSGRREAAQVTVGGGKKKQCETRLDRKVGWVCSKAQWKETPVLCLRKLQEAQDGKDRRGVKWGKMLRALMGYADTLTEALRNQWRTLGIRV